MKTQKQKLNSSVGCMLGAAIGDAFGAPLEFLEARAKDQWVTEMVGGGVLKWEPGQLTDDTTMAIPIAEMYILNNGYDQNYLLDQWIDWLDSKPKDIGVWTYETLYAWKKNRAGIDVAKKHWVKSGMNAAGNGGIMRCYPTAIAEPLLNKRLEDTAQICSLTHPDPRCIQSCVLVVELIHEMIENNLSKEDVCKLMNNMLESIFKNTELFDAVNGIETESVENCTNGGYTIETIQSALCAFYNSTDFESGLIAIVNQGNDADSVGSVAGALMGAFYGYDAIPKRWLDLLEKRDYLVSLAESLYSRKETAAQESEI